MLLARKVSVETVQPLSKDSGRGKRRHVYAACMRIGILNLETMVGGKEGWDMQRVGVTGEDVAMG